MFKYIFLGVIAISTLATDVIIKIYEKHEEKSKTEDKKRIYKDTYTISELFPNEEIKNIKKRRNKDMKLIELLNKIANDTLEDNTRVIIENKLYCYDKEDKKLYKSDERNKFRIIQTDDLNIEVEIIDKIETEQNNNIEEIDIKNLKELKYTTIIEEVCIDKINEIIRVVNNKY